LVVVPKVLDAVLDKSHRVVLIVDGEPTGVAFIQLLDVLTQDAHAEAVKCRQLEARWEVPDLAAASARAISSPALLCS
jgi:hypothetical protein